MSGRDTYKSPLETRYCSVEMKNMFGAGNRRLVRRKLSLLLAEAEKEVGVEGTDAADTCYVTDNAQLILMRDAMDLLIPKLAKVIHNLSQTALKSKDTPTLGYTHFQPAQLITVGRRAAQWVQDLMMDLENFENQRKRLEFLGAMGATGTQASFMEIFHGDDSKIGKLNEILCAKTGFPKTYDISVQTYSRKVDLDVANVIAGLGATAIHIASDIRHLSHDKEIEEPFEKDQIGSSAMAYKRNAMRCERICGLSRIMRNLPAIFADTFADTLDGSATCRMKIPKLMLLADAVLITLDNVTSGLVIYPKRIHANIMQELPFMATETIIMKMVAAGGSRQEAHEEIRVLSHQASDVVKKEGGKNDLIERLKATDYFRPVWDKIDGLLDPSLFVGRCGEMVERYCGAGGPVEARLAPYKEYIDKTAAAELSL